MAEELEKLHAKTVKFLVGHFSFFGCSCRLHVGIYTSSSLCYNEVSGWGLGWVRHMHMKQVRQESQYFHIMCHMWVEPELRVQF